MYYDGEADTAAMHYQGRPVDLAEV